MVTKRVLNLQRLKLLLVPWIVCLACTAWAEFPGIPGSKTPEQAGEVVKLANREICVFRATLDGYSPEERAAAAAARLRSVMANAGTVLVTTQAVPSGIQLSLDGKALFVLTTGDVSRLRGETLECKAADVSKALRTALHELSTLTDVGELAWVVVQALFGVILLWGILWSVNRGKRWVLTRSTRLAAAKTERVKSRGLRIVGLRSFVEVVRASLNFVSYLLMAFGVYAFVWYELRRFPYSRPWGDYLRSQCASVLISFGNSILGALPDLLVLVFIVLAARLLVHALSQVFAAVEREEIETHLLDPGTAATTRRLLVFLVWVIAVLVAYPYIPGSQTLAFKGVTVFAGLLISLGSTNIISQMASGLLLIYSRAFRAGDYVRVGETEGTILGVGVCATRICTIKNEQVQIANSVLLGTVSKNFTRLADSQGLLLPAKVTISYSTPWRLVHAMLLEAARRTRGLAQSPGPFVLQTSLSDFYVEYELNACLEHPEQRVWVQSDLHAHIQDVFNEHSVQIMSPHYLQDPPRPQVVPQSEWYPTSAKLEKIQKAGAAQVVGVADAQAVARKSL